MSEQWIYEQLPVKLSPPRNGLSPGPGVRDGIVVDWLAQNGTCYGLAPGSQWSAVSYWTNVLLSKPSCHGSLSQAHC
jgi:hypothetical protein